MKIHHHFIGQDHGKGVYAKETHFQAGAVVDQETHSYGHLSILARGSVLWAVEGDAPRLITGPCAISVEAGAKHSLRAVTDAVWFCVHPTDETDPDRVDDAILERERA